MELPDELVLPGARLRALRKDDWLLDHALSRVVDVTRWTYYPADVDEQEARRRVGRNLTQRAEGRGGRFVVERSGEALGTIGLGLRDEGPHLYYAFLPAGRGLGLATEAVRALTRWALEHGAEVVIARTMVGNTASERVLERASFRRGPFEVEPDGVSVIRWSCTPSRTTYSPVTYAPVGYDRGMTTVGPSRPTAAPRDVAIPDEPLTAALDRAAQRWPDRTAVDFLGAPTTYAELAEAVARGAQVLLDLGVKPGDRVALVMPNCTGHVVAFYAALRIGAVVVEHNPTYTTGELAHQLADSGAVVALVWEKAVQRVLESLPRTALKAVVAVDLSADLSRGKRLALRLPVPSARRVREAMCGKVPPAFPMWHRLVAKAAPLDPAHPAPSAADVALLQYTGGTTGTPKGAMLTHRNLVANAVQGHAWTGAEPGTEVVYGVLPFFHAFGLTLCLSYAIRVGATLVAFPSFDPERVLDAQRRLPGTFLPAVPPMLDRLAAAAETSGADLSSFRYAISGAMALPAATAEKWEQVTGGFVIEGYGMTETSPVALGNPLTDARRPGTLGLPFPSTSIRVVDPADVTHEVEPGERGELLIRGPQVFAGYWGRPDETAEQLLDDGWLRTGDIVTVDDTGWVVLVDRIKEVIVTGGFKVYPSQVEEHLRTMPGVADVAVVGIPGGDLGETVVAAVVLEPGAGGVDLDAVRAWGERHLARYALPRKLVLVDELPRSQVGKVLRRVVRESVLAG